MHPAKGFVADAYAHAKFIGHSAAAMALMTAAGVTDSDEGMVPIDSAADTAPFVEMLGKLRFWDRVS